MKLGPSRLAHLTFFFSLFMVERELSGSLLYRPHRRARVAYSLLEHGVPLESSCCLVQGCSGSRYLHLASYPSKRWGKLSIHSSNFLDLSICSQYLCCKSVTPSLPGLETVIDTKHPHTHTYQGVIFRPCPLILQSSLGVNVLADPHIHA